MDRFTPTERQLLIALPYRVGLWVSESDKSGGDDSDNAEMQAFEAMMTGYTEDLLKAEFVEELLRATILAKKEWAGWTKNVDGVPNEIRKSIDICYNQLPVSEINSLRQSLMEIAKTVAMAYREVEPEELKGAEKMKIHFRYYRALLHSKLYKNPQPNLESFFNISDDEAVALKKLAEILRVDMNGAPLEPVQKK
jgi:hypothetical protein